MVSKWLLSLPQSLLDLLGFGEELGLGELGLGLRLDNSSHNKSYFCCFRNNCSCQRCQVSLDSCRTPHYTTHQPTQLITLLRFVLTSSESGINMQAASWLVMQVVIVCSSCNICNKYGNKYGISLVTKYGFLFLSILELFFSLACCWATNNE